MLFALISCLRHQDFTKAKDFSAAADTKLKGMHHNYRNLMISKYLTIKDGLNIESPDYLRSRLAYYSLFIASLFLCFFCIYNFFTEVYWVALVDGIALILTTTAIFDYYHHKNLQRLDNTVILVLYFLFIPLTLITKNQDFTLIWTFFFPLFAIITKGQYSGLIHTAVFYSIIFPIVFMGIGEWQNGTWSDKSFLRFALASLLLTYIIFYFKKSHDQVYDKLRGLLTKQKMLSKEMEMLSITDPLTGLYNRRHLQQTFQREFNRARRDGHYFCFFIFDLDHFKEYNDNYGHGQGDIVLCQVTDIFKDCMRRSSDLAFRFGGEEFCGLLVSNNDHDANLLVDDIRRKVEAKNIKHSHNDGRGVLTVSAGIHILHGDTQISFTDLYKATDRALYQAKARGRNCCVNYTTEHEELNT
ncbi:MAG: GGDEF domain-containing protein [Candidatus Thiodiazotropha sp. (ex Lucinoma borealis)]|nr:GGDEF domain-containing protein [Candidatus Thiodiazotropha sp. (ex Lucinoma borealis)]